MKESEILERARRYGAIKAQAEKLAKDARAEAEALDAEFRRRSSTSLGVGGATVTMKGRRQIDIDVDVLREGGAKPALLKRITKVVVVRDAAETEVKAGKLARELLDLASTVTESARWPVVTDARPAAAA